MDFAHSPLALVAFISPSWNCHHGYPQPDEEHFGYLQATYDPTNYCKHCD